MKRFNVIVLADAAGQNVLMCRRMKPPYQGLLNLVGGKVEPGEDDLHAAYRELREETGVTIADVRLHHLMTLTYPAACSEFPATELQVYAGRLRHEVTLSEEANPLLWVPLTEDFFDMERFSGEGNIGHMIETLRRYRPEMLEARAPAVKIAPIAEDDLPILAHTWGCDESKLRPMLEASCNRVHEGRCYEQFCIRVHGCVVGTVSMCDHRDGVVSDGVEVFPPFRRCGFSQAALKLLMDMAAANGYRWMKAQVRTDNTASIALHRRMGFFTLSPYVNQRGNEVHSMLKRLDACPGASHEMSLRPKPFEAVASSRKRYELRLNDEKRKAIRVGDEIVFTCTPGETAVRVRVTSLHPFDDFASLYASLPLLECGYTPDNVHRADPRDMEAYYSPEKQAQYGVLAIGIERVRYPVTALTGMYEVRELTDADVPEMLRLAQGNPLYYEYMGNAPDVPGMLESLHALPPRRTAADKHFFGWFRAGRMIAMMDLIAHYPKDDMAFIGWFMVDASAQGCGLGRTLVADVLTMLDACGVREVRLGRVKGNPQSERFWHTCGFQENGLSYETDGYTVLVMSRTLA